jgi:hypothetical protein
MQARTAVAQTKQSKESGIKMRRSWIQPVAISVLSTLVATAILVSTPIFRSNLSITLHTPHFEWLDIEVDRTGARNRFVAWSCVKNRGIRLGSISRAEIRPDSIDKMPHARVLQVSQPTIWPFTTRLVRTDFIVEQTLSDAAKDLKLAVDLYDDSDIRIGSMVLEGWYAGDSAVFESWSRADPRSKHRETQAIKGPPANFCSRPENPAEPVER